MGWIVKALIALIGLAVLGSYLSTINPDACARGSLACGTAWWMVLVVVIAVAMLLRAALAWMRLRRQHDRKL